MFARGPHQDFGKWSRAPRIYGRTTGSGTESGCRMELRVGDWVRGSLGEGGRCDLGQGFGMHSPGGREAAGQNSDLGEGCRRECRIWEGVMVWQEVGCKRQALAGMRLPKQLLASSTLRQASCLPASPEIPCGFLPCSTRLRTLSPPPTKSPSCHWLKDFAGGGDSVRNLPLPVQPGVTVPAPKPLTCLSRYDISSNRRGVATALSAQILEHLTRGRGEHMVTSAHSATHVRLSCMM